MTKYYQGSRARMVAEFEQLRMRQCGFAVAGREVDGGKFLMLGDIDLPEEVEGLFWEIHEQDFRADISSTAIR